jgi:RNA polymerase sigma-70 factor, ECF subfamily
LHQADSVDNQELVWLEQARQGDQLAFCKLVEAYQGPVYNLAYRMLGNDDEAKDATQETFVRIYTKLHTYQPDRKLSSWVLAIASHYCIDRLRRRGRGSWLSLDEDPLATVLPSSDRSPEDNVLRAETRDEIQGLVEQLTPSYRIPLILRYWQEMSYQEIADVLGLSVQAVKSRLHRARLQITEKVAQGLEMTENPAESR